MDETKIYQCWPVWCGGNVPERGDPPPQETFLKKSGKARLNGSDDVAGAAGVCKGSVAEALASAKPYST